MEEVEIKYKFNPEHFQELCDSTGGKSIFTYTPTKSGIIAIVFTLVLTAIFYIVAIKYPSVGFLIFIGFVLIVWSILYFGYRLVAYIKLRRNIKKYLRFMEGKKLSITVKNDFIKIESDRGVFIERVDDVKSVLLRDDCITLKSKEDVSYYFIAKSMEAESYQRLKKIIESKLI